MTSFEPYSVHGLFTEEVVEILYNTDFLLKVLSVTYLLFDIFYPRKCVLRQLSDH